VNPSRIGEPCRRSAARIASQSRERAERRLAVLVGVRGDHHQLHAGIGQAGIDVVVESDLGWMAGLPVLLLQKGLGLGRARREDLAEGDHLQPELLEVLCQEPRQVPHTAKPCPDHCDSDRLPALSLHTAPASYTQMGELQAHWSFF
jgi:hypothetical protein